MVFPNVMSRAAKKAQRNHPGTTPGEHELPMTELAYQQTRSALSAGPPERGMALFGFLKDGIVRQVLLDDTARCTSASYTPDFERLNRLCTEMFTPAQLVPLGFAHSHPGASSRPSGGDLEYAARILEANPFLPRLLLPIVTLDGGFVFHTYVALRAAGGVSIERAKLRLMREDLAPVELPMQPPVEAPPVPPDPYWRRKFFGIPLPHASRLPWWQSESFTRVQGAYDLPRLARSCVVIVGNGGCMAGVEDLARCGIGRFVLIDFDRVSRANIATQLVYRGDVGKPKVEVLRRRIKRINPEAEVMARPVRLEDIPDAEFEDLIGLHDATPPIRTLILGMTDSFPAQARVNRLALNYSLASVCAQMYREGRAGEATFTLPGLSRCCHRCLLEQRYRAYLEEGYQNDVTSDGSPISSTERLNAIAVFLTLALLHHGSGHPRWNGIAEGLGTRNLIQVQMHPDAHLPILDGIAVGGGRHIFQDAAISWASQPADGSDDRPVCPDCGGTGDLHDAAGSFKDTRQMRVEWQP